MIFQFAGDFFIDRNHHVGFHLSPFTDILCIHGYPVSIKYGCGLRTTDCGLGIKHGLGIKCGLRTEYKTRARYKTRTTDCVYKTALER